MLTLASFLFFLWLGLGAETAAANQNCNTMSAYACSAGVHKDGTGNVRQVLESETSNDAILAKWDRPVRARLKILMARAEASGLRTLLAESQAKVSENDFFIVIQKSLGSEGVSASTANAETVAKIKKHPYFKEIVHDLRNEISKRVTDPRKKLRLKKVVFPELKRLLMQKVNSLPVDESQRAIMIKKIASVRLDGDTKCDIGGKPRLFRTIAHYDSEKDLVRVCDGSLSENYSEFKLAHSIAHELSHSIDPCNLGTSSASYDRAAMESTYPLKNLISCLRSENSVMAQSLPAQHPVESDTPSDRPAVFDFCAKDQINEAVADWFSNELLPKYIEKHFPKLTRLQWQEGISNVFRFNCNDPVGENDTHPTIEFRLQRLLLVQPQVRQRMGCEQASSFQYCGVTP